MFLAFNDSSVTPGVSWRTAHCLLCKRTPAVAPESFVCSLVSTPSHRRITKGSNLQPKDGRPYFLLMCFAVALPPLSFVFIWTWTLIHSLSCDIIFSITAPNTTIVRLPSIQIMTQTKCSKNATHLSKRRHHADFLLMLWILQVCKAF